MNDQVNTETVEQPVVQLEGQEQKQTATAPAAQAKESKEDAEKRPL